MIYNISFKSYKDGEVVEEGFDTVRALDLNDALRQADGILDLSECDKVELTANKLSLK